MELKDKNIGFAITGSFCTFKAALKQIESLIKEGANVLPIMSQTAAATDTRFGKASDFILIIETMTGCPIISTIAAAEPIGPKKLLDLLIIAPCTGNTLGKLACGITDTAVTMAVKAHLRNERPVLISPSTNDGLGGSAGNIGLLMNVKNIYFVPYGQDDPKGKPNSLVADMELVLPAARMALDGKQMQPVVY